MRWLQPNDITGIDKMTSKKKFSRFLVLTLVAFEVVSLALVVGVLYSNLSMTMTQEFLQEVTHEASEISTAIRDRLHSMEMRLGAMSSNNTLRVSLMLEVESQLEETMEKLYSSSDGAFFLTHSKASSLFIPDIPADIKSVRSYLDRLVIDSSPQKVKFVKSGDGQFLSIFSTPVLRRDERLGTALVVYNISQDTRFWKTLRLVSAGKLCIQDNRHLIDLQTGLKQSLSIKVLDTSKSSLSSSQQAAFTPLGNFPGLVYTTSSRPLQESKTSLIYTLLLLCSGIFLMTLLVAFMIARKVSIPLRSMVNQALKIAGDPSSSPLREEELKYDEFGKLGQSFNQVLSSLLEAQEELKNQAKKQLDASEKRYQTLVETSPTGILSIDAHGNILFANRTFERITGYDQGDLRAVKFKDLFEPDEHEVILQLISGDLELERNETHEVRLLRKNGDAIWVAFRATGIPDREGQALLLNVLDITKRKQAEESLQEREVLLRDTLESTGDGILVVNESGQVTHTNSQFVHMWRIPPELVEAHNDDKLLMFVLGQLKEPEAFLSKVRELYDSTRIDHDTLLFKDGRVFERYSSPLIRGDKVAGRVWSFRDVTDREQTQEEKRKLQAELQRAEKMETVGMLAGGVAHDLNNVLSGLVSYPDLLLMDLPEGSPLREPILTMQKSGKRAANIVEDLLTLARRGVAVSEVANLNDIITEYLMSPEHQKLKGFHRNAKIETDLEADLLNVLASPVHLSKTVMNLVSNAAEALPEKGVVTVTTENQYVDKPIRGYDAVEQGDYVVLSVSDNGIGISAEDLERIFEPFYTKKMMGRSGTGLGMAVVWGTVKDLSGYIDVKSTEGKGTTFKLFFPVTRKEAEQDESVASLEVCMGSGEEILVVDDIEEQRHIATMLLTKLGYSVKSVSSGEEAVEYMRTESADLLILDMIMEPGIDGLDTYKKILEHHPRQKAIIASGFSETERVKEAQRLGAGQYIKKPYTLEKIGLAARTELAKQGRDFLLYSKSTLKLQN